jgi:DNA repair exonuclease SbcCD ATPase subunit
MEALRQGLYGLVARWRRECEEARAETERTNARLLAGEILTSTVLTGPSPLGKEQAASELEELLADRDGGIDRQDRCPMCGSPLAYCPQGEYCTSTKCSYAM